MKEVVVFGNSVLSKMIYLDSLSHATCHICAFAVEQQYLSSSTFCGLPLIDVDQVAVLYPPSTYNMLAVVGGFSDMRFRASYYDRARSFGYELINYISSKADFHSDTLMGDNNIILGFSSIGFDGEMGNNNIIRQKVYLGHNFKIGNHNFIGVDCNIGGNCNISNLCYIAMGSTIINNITLENETLIGAGSVVIRNTEPCSKNVGNPTRIIGYHSETGIKLSINHG